MSKKGRNNHYHYAEKFSDRARRGSGSFFHIPNKAAILALVVLLMFGLVSTTFAAYVSSEEVTLQNPSGGGLTVSVRNIRASRESDIALSGGDMDLAASGGTINMYQYGSNRNIFFYYNDAFSNFRNLSNFAHLYFVIGHNTYYSRYEMTRVSNSALFRLNDTGSGNWENASYIFILATNNTWSGNKSESISGGSATVKGWSGVLGSTNDYTSSYNFNSNSGGYTYLLNTSSSATKTITPYAIGDGDKYGTLKGGDGYLTYKTQVQPLNSTSYSNSTATGVATIKLKSGYWSSSTAMTLTEAESSAGSTSYNSAGLSAETILSYSNKGAAYDFIGFYKGDSSSGGTMTTLATSGTSVTVYPQTYTGSAQQYQYYFARFRAKPKVTLSETGTHGTIKFGTTTVSSPSSIKTSAYISKATNTSVKITAPAGCTVSAVSSSVSGSLTSGSGLNTGEYTGTLKLSANATLSVTYAIINPTLTMPADVTYTATTNTSSTIIKAPTCSTAASGITADLEFSYSVPPGAVSTGSNPDYTYNESTGAFWARTPGTYTITAELTYSKDDLTSTTASDSIVITVKAPEPTYTIEIAGHTSGDGESAATKAMVPRGANADSSNPTFTITTEIDEDYQDDFPGCTYQWSFDGGTTYQALPSGSDGSTFVYAPPTATAGDYTLNIKVKVTKNSVSTVEANANLRYYSVYSNFIRLDDTNFSSDRTPVQKIYNADTNNETIKTSYFADGDTFTALMYFSKDNQTFESITLSNTGTSYTKAQIAALETFDVSQWMNQPGVKNFKFTVTDNNNVSVTSDTLHTTVGTSQTSSSVVLYYNNASSGVTTSGNRVMAVYILDGDVKFQTGQATTLLGSTDVYRFHLPSDATALTFFVAKTDRYKIPVYNPSLGAYSFDSNCHIAATEVLEISASTPVFTATGASSDTIPIIEGSFAALS